MPGRWWIALPIVEATSCSNLTASMEQYPSRQVSGSISSKTETDSAPISVHCSQRACATGRLMPGPAKKVLRCAARSSSIDWLSSKLITSARESLISTRFLPPIQERTTSILLPAILPHSGLQWNHTAHFNAEETHVHRTDALAAQTQAAADQLPC